MVWNHGLFMTFDILKNVIIPTDFYVFQRGRYTTNQIMTSQHFCWYIGDSYVLHIWWVFELVRMYGWDTLRLFMFLFPYFFPKHAPSYIQRLQISILSLALKTWMVSPTTRASNAFMSFSWGCQEDDWVIDCVIVSFNDYPPWNMGTFPWKPPFLGMFLCRVWLPKSNCLVVWNMTFMTFHSVGNVIIPTDFYVFSER